MSRLLVVILLLSLAPSGRAGEKTQPKANCRKHVSVAVATHQGLEQSAPTFVMSWWSKNANKYPDICLEPGRLVNEPGHYLLLISASQENIDGVTSTVINYTGTAEHTVRDNGGYTSGGTITTSTPVRENVELTENNRPLLMNMYDSHGLVIGQEGHPYSMRSGGDDTETFGHNLGNLLGAIGARGRMLKNLLRAVNAHYDVDTAIRTEKAENGPEKLDPQQSPLDKGNGHSIADPETARTEPNSTALPATATIKDFRSKPTAKCSGEEWYVSPSGEPICVWNH